MNISIPKDLQDAINNDKLVIFVGAGLSKKVGIADWSEIVHSTLKNNRDYIDKADAYINALENGIMQPLTILDNIIESKPYIYKEFENQLRTNIKNSETHTLLGKISNKFITTNFDKIIENTCNIDEVLVYDSNWSLSKIDSLDKYILKIHGDINQVDKCVIFSSQYEKLYREDGLSQFQIKKLLSEFSFLFLGFSFNDPYVKELFDYVSNLLDGYGPKHFIVSDRNKNISGLKDINIKTYENLDSFLVELANLKRQKHKNKDTTTTNHNILHKEKDGSDIPPTVKNWVGREKELSLLHENGFKVIFITGIGGEGKSALASHYLSNASGFDFYDWRDFKEQEHKFQNKISSMIIKINNKIVENDLTGLSDDELVDIFFEYLEDKKAIFVLDNIDSYIDLDNFEPVDGIGKLFKKAINTNHCSKFIFTCRPFIRYAGVEFYQLTLSGLSERDTIELFKASSSNISKSKIEFYARKSHQLTKGHALWLSLIVAQSYRGEASLISFIEKIELNINIDENDSTIMSRNLLSHVWSSLHDRDQLLLRTLAESVVSESVEDYATILKDELNYKNFQRALKALRNFNLVIEKKESNYIELHPLVKEFIRKNYQTSDRSKYIGLIVTYYDKFIYVLREKLSHKLSFDEFSNFTNKAELSINARNYQSAISTLWEVESSMTAAGYIEEFLRVSKKLFSSISWSRKVLQEYDHFFDLLCECIKISVQYGDDLLTKNLIDKFENIVDKKESTYIRLCDVKSYKLWFENKFKESINICEEALYLLNRADQPDNYDIAHTLALAQRDSLDSENINKALQYFLKTNSLDSVLELKNLPKNQSGTMYGNIGKCFNLLGENEKALICYIKSFHYIYNSNNSDKLINLGYASLWISEVLHDNEQYEQSFYFLKYANEQWNSVSPVLNNRNRAKFVASENNATFRSIWSQELWRVEKYCIDFINKRLNL